MTNEILVVDDNSDIRLLISGILKDKGVSVREAANFDQALNEIDRKVPDVAIIDVKLDKGDNDGIELLTRIKKIDDAGLATKTASFSCQVFCSGSFAFLDNDCSTGEENSHTSFGNGFFWMRFSSSVGIAEFLM